MLDFYLSVNNSEEVVHIPVTPSSFSVTNSQSTETFKSAGYGWIKIIGNTELRGVSWDGTFPVHDYPFRRDASMEGQEYYEKLKSWQKLKIACSFSDYINRFCKHQHKYGCSHRKIRF